MIEGPLVSVILSTYNDEKYIHETISSVLTQTYHNFEFIIWNDGSTDETEKAVMAFQDPRIKYFYHDNTGIGKARFMATAEARGKYIAVIDGDDIWMPTRLAECVKFMETHKEYVLVCTQAFYINENGNLIGESFSVTTDYNIRKRFPLNVITHSSTLFSKEAYDSVGGYAGLRQGLDQLLFMRMAKVGKMKMLNRTLVKYRVHHSSISHSYNPYRNTLINYRMKMAKDSDISSWDIEIYNSICVRATELRKNFPNPSRYSYKTTIEERVYGVIKCFLGNRISRFVLVAFKNCVVFIKIKMQF